MKGEEIKGDSQMVNTGLYDSMLYMIKSFEILYNIALYMPFLSCVCTILIMYCNNANWSMGHKFEIRKTFNWIEIELDLFTLQEYL